MWTKWSMTTWWPRSTTESILSTISIITATQLAFTAIFAFFILKQKFTIFFSIASVILLVAGGGFLAVDADRAKAAAETSSRYIFGIIMTFLSSAVPGLVYPLIEFLYIKSNTEICYTLVMETQMILSFFGTIVSIIGMLATNAFQAIPHETRTFTPGETIYYLVIISIAIFFQIVLLGTVGIVVSSSALLSGIVTAVLVPVSEVLAVLCLHEDFSVGKGLSLGLCLLGFASYYYGEIRQTKQSSLIEEDASQLLLHDTIITTTPNTITQLQN